MTAALPRILCVDDVPAVLTSIGITLRKDYDVHTATSGEQALRMLAENEYSVLCTDMRMPGMMGNELLKRAIELYPEMTRIVFTGEPGRDIAANAVNDGQIFRFLTKPCPPDKLKAAIEAGVTQHNLVSAERVLLQETLVGCIKVLVDVLAITNPVAFGRASRIKRLTKELANDLGLRGFWQLDAAALLSQLGYLSLPVELVEKLYHGEPLSPEEKVLAAGAPAVARKLLGHIPRLEPVLQILSGVAASETVSIPQSDQTKAYLQTGIKILSLVTEFDGLVMRGISAAGAIEQIKKQGAKYDADLIEKLGNRVGASADGEEVRHVLLRSVLPGMILLDELRNEKGELLMPRGFEVSEGFVARLRNLGAKLLSENVRVQIRNTSQP